MPSSRRKQNSTNLTAGSFESVLALADSVLASACVQTDHIAALGVHVGANAAVAVQGQPVTRIARTSVEESCEKTQAISYCNTYYCIPSTLLFTSNRHTGLHMNVQIYSTCKFYNPTDKENIPVDNILQ